VCPSAFCPTWIYLSWVSESSVRRTFISPVSHYQSNTQTKSRVWLARNDTHGQARSPSLPVKCHLDVTELIRPGMPEIVWFESSDVWRGTRDERKWEARVQVSKSTSRRSNRTFPGFFFWLRQRSLVRLVVSAVDSEATVVASAFPQLSTYFHPQLGRHFHIIGTKAVFDGISIGCDFRVPKFAVRTHRSPNNSFWMTGTLFLPVDNT
jgi:hypothetical protein